MFARPTSSATPLSSAMWRGALARAAPPPAIARGPPPAGAGAPAAAHADHRGGARRGEREARGEERPGPAMSQDVGAVSNPVLERAQPRTGSAQLAGHPHEVARTRAAAVHEPVGRLAPAGHA